MGKDEAINVLKNANLTEKRRNLQNIIFLYHAQKMGKEIIIFGDIENEKGKFHYQKNLIFLEDLDVNKITGV